MALIPFAEKKLIYPGSNDPPIVPIGIIWHVDAGNASDLHDFFKHRSGGIESHGHVRLDGHLFQYRDTDYEADANLKANSFYMNGRRFGYLSFETQGYGDGLWTKAQLDTINEVNRWGHEVHGIPMRVCRTPQDGGVGYHTLFGSPSEWTPVAKSCPGPNRIKQFYSTVVPRMQSGEEEAEMNTQEKAQMVRIEQKLDKLQTAFSTFRGNEADRDRATKARLVKILQTGAKKADLEALVKELEAEEKA